MKNEKFKLVLVGLLITFGICVLIYVANNCIPEHLKLDAGIWGTVDSWMVYLVTLVTAVLVYKTLDSQQKTLESQRRVQEDQNRTFKIEEFKYLRDNKPTLKFTETRNNIFVNSRIVAIELTIDLSWDKSCKIKSKLSNKNQVFTDDSNYSTFLKGGNKSFNMTIPLQENDSTILNIDFTYKDYDGNAYLQENMLEFFITNHQTVERKRYFLGDNIISKVY